MGIVVADALVSDFKLVLKSSAKILKATLSIAPLDIPSYPSLESHTEWIRAVAVTPDGRKVVTGSSDYTIKIWDMESGLEIKSLKGHEGCIRAVAITPDGRKIVSGSDDCTLKIWDLESGREIGSLEGHLTTLLQFQSRRMAVRL